MRNFVLIKILLLAFSKISAVKKIFQRAQDVTGKAGGYRDYLFKMYFSERMIVFHFSAKSDFFDSRINIPGSSYAHSFVSGTVTVFVEIAPDKRS